MIERLLHLFTFLAVYDGVGNFSDYYIHLIAEYLEAFIKRPAKHPASYTVGHPETVSGHPETVSGQRSDRRTPYVVRGLLNFNGRVNKSLNCNNCL